MDGALAIDQGKMQTLGINGRPLLQSLRWSFQPWWLPLLRASFHVEGGNQELNLKGRAALVFGGITDRLIPLFALGAFLAFTLSQAGMVAHWIRVGGAHQTRSIIVNGVGALATNAIYQWRKFHSRDFT